MDVDPLEDPMLNWREKVCSYFIKQCLDLHFVILSYFFFKYGDDPKEVMQEGTEWKKGPSSTMFKKLFR